MPSRSSLPKNYTRSDGVEIDNFSDGWEKNGANGTLTDDTEFYWTGTKGLKLAVTSAGSTCTAQKTISLKFAKNSLFSLYVYLHDDPSKYENMRVYISSTEFFSKYKEGLPIARGSYGRGTLVQGWNKLIFPFNDEIFTDTGGESYENTFIRIRIRITGSAGNICSATLGLLENDEKFYPKTILRFDDASDGVYSKAYPIMKALGLKGTIYAMGAQVGTSGRCTLSQLQEMYADGWDISNHSYSHPDFRTLSLEETRYELKTNQEWLFSNGFTRSARHHALTGGEDNSFIRQVISELEMQTVTTSTVTLFYPEFKGLNYNYEWNALTIPSQVIADTTTLQQLKDIINKQYNNKKSSVLMFHEIADSPSNTYEYSTANFEAFCKYLVERKVDVVTMSEFYEGLTNPRKQVSRI